MKIITRLSDLELEVGKNLDKEEVIQLVFEALQAGFEAQTADGQYFSESFSETSFVFGCDDPDKVCQIVHDWNRDIKTQFVRRFQTLGGPDIEAGNLPMDTPETYDMQKAARELDNNWWAYADHGVYLNNEMGFSYFRVVLTDKEQEEIIKNLDDYVVADLYVKD